jgi:hypothetical protein
VQRVSTTVVGIVGEGARAAVERLGTAANVVAVLPAADRPPLERAVAAWDEARRAHVPYLVHDADPLAAVTHAWVARFDEAGPVGDLEVAVTETLARWRAGSIELPDYYVVLDAEELEVTQRHWYLGVLHSKATARVIPARDAGHAAAELQRLPTGPWWPALDTLLDGIDQVVPERVGSPAR